MAEILDRFMARLSGYTHDGNHNALGPKGESALRTLFDGNETSTPEVFARILFQLLAPHADSYFRNQYETPLSYKEVVARVAANTEVPTDRRRGVATNLRRVLRAISYEIQGDFVDDLSQRKSPLAETLLKLAASSLFDISISYAELLKAKDFERYNPASPGILFGSKVWTLADYAGHLYSVRLGETRHTVRYMQGLTVVPYTVLGDSNGHIELPTPARVAEIIWAPNFQKAENSRGFLELSKEATLELIQQLRMTDKDGLSCLTVNRGGDKPVVLPTPEYVVIKTHPNLAIHLPDMITSWQEQGLGLVSEVQTEVIPGASMPLEAGRIRETAVLSNPMLDRELERYPDIHVYVLKLNRIPATQEYVDTLRGMIARSRGSGGRYYSGGVGK